MGDLLFSSIPMSLNSIIPVLIHVICAYIYGSKKFLNLLKTLNLLCKVCGVCP